MRRQFELPAADVEYLDVRGFQWETVVEGGGRWLIVCNFPVPVGYHQHPTAVAAIQIANGYPDAALDMVYFTPFITRVDGGAIGATDSRLTLDGKEWQRWSRHYTSENPWRVGEDDLSGHIQLIEDWLAREFRKP
jgi:hypothetical protein